MPGNFLHDKKINSLLKAASPYLTYQPRRFPVDSLVRLTQKSRQS